MASRNPHLSSVLYQGLASAKPPRICFLSCIRARLQPSRRAFAFCLVSGLGFSQAAAHLLSVLYQGLALAKPKPAHPFFKKQNPRQSRAQTRTHSADLDLPAVLCSVGLQTRVPGKLAFSLLGWETGCRAGVHARTCP
jgi:hypothetical protein